MYEEKCFKTSSGTNTSSNTFYTTTCNTSPCCSS
jgi:hypothetical protein